MHIYIPENFEGIQNRNLLERSSGPSESCTLSILSNLSLLILEKASMFHCASFIPGMSKNMASIFSFPCQPKGNTSKKQSQSKDL
jgi:hypothetical protein